MSNSTDLKSMLAGMHLCRKQPACNLHTRLPITGYSVCAGGLQLLAASNLHRPFCQSTETKPADDRL